MNKDNKFHIFFRNNFVFIVGIFSVTFLVFLLSKTERFYSYNNSLFDSIRNFSYRKEVAVVGIDDKTLKSLGAWPFNREVFANLTSKLDELGAKVVVYDVLFLEKREGDDLFEKTLSNINNKVILGAKLEDGSVYESYLSLNKKNVLSAVANVLPDDDGKVRSFPKAQLLNGKCFYGLGEQAFNIWTFKNKSTCDYQEGSFRYADKLDEYSLVDILNGKVSKEKINGKVIFIGSTSLDLEDHFVGMNGNKIPGVYVHANIFSSLLSGISDNNTNDYENIIIYLIISLLTVFALYKTNNSLVQIISVFGIFVFSFIFATLLFSYGIIVPLISIFLIIILISIITSFYRFINERKSNKEIKTLFSKYVHKDVLDEIIRSGNKINLGGEKRELAILFSDLRGFTTIAETLEPEELTKMLNDYLSKMTPCILEEKGTIDKFIGDAVMAFWNAPLTVDEYATRAVRSALSMQDALKEFNKENKTKLQMGIGLHLGNVTVGNVGSNERVNYTILGDNVNLTSRIEGLTKKYKIGCIVTEEIKEKVNDENIIFRKLDVITVKGKSLPTVIYGVRRKDEKTEELFSEYQKAFDMYQKKDFEGAGNIFQKLKEEGDGPSEVILERIDEVKKIKDWDGIYHFEEK